MSDLLLASNNAKKLAELQRILEPLVPGLRVLGQDPAHLLELLGVARRQEDPGTGVLIHRRAPPAAGG